MNWCEHMDILSDSLRKGIDIKIPQITTLFGVEIKFCPICGVAAPRPSEPKEHPLTLIFREEIKAHDLECFADGTRHKNCTLWDDLRKKSEQYFLSQLEGKEVEEALSITLKHQEYVLDKVPDGLGGYCTNWRYLAKQAIQFIKERILQ